MNSRNLLASSLTLMCVLISACAPAATAMPTTVPPASVSPIIEPTIIPAQGPRRYSPKGFELISSISFSPSWVVKEDSLQHLDIEKGPTVVVVLNDVTTAQLADPADGHAIPFPDDFVSWIQSDPDFHTSQPTPVTIGGINGIQIDATYISKISQKQFGLNWNSLSSDGQYHFVLLENVKGERVLIFMVAPPGKTFGEVPELQQEIQGILDSVVFAK